MINWHESQLKALLGQPQQLAHALLLRGPRGIGKQLMAQALAKGLLCESPAVDGLACGHCAACTWFDGGNHPDFRLLSPDTGAEPAGESEEGVKAREAKATPWITIEQVRGLHDFINVSSHRGGRKVILLDPAEALNQAAANALLKSLEEPPPGTHFILLSHRPQRLMRTIVSRCRQLALHAPARSEALQWLAGQGIARPEVLLAQASGAPLLALAMQEGDELEGRQEFLHAIADVDMDALAVAEACRDLPLERFILWLQKWTCDLVEQRMLGRIRYNPDFAGPLSSLARRMDPLQALRLQRKLVREQRHIHHPLNARLYMESVLLAYAALVNPPRGRTA